MKKKCNGKRREFEDKRMKNKKQRKKDLLKIVFNESDKRNSLYRVKIIDA